MLSSQQRQMLKIFNFFFESKKEGKDQEPIQYNTKIIYIVGNTNSITSAMNIYLQTEYNQAPHLTKDTTWESSKITIKHHTQESQEVSPFPAGDHKQTRKQKHETQITNMIHKRSTALKRSVKTPLLEGLN